jgi:hypothetical protein
MPIDHHATQQEKHELYGERLADALRTAADLIESKGRDGWEARTVETSVGGLNRVEVVFHRDLEV